MGDLEYKIMGGIFLFLVWVKITENNEGPFGNTYSWSISRDEPLYRLRLPRLRRPTIPWNNKIFPQEEEEIDPYPDDYDGD